eukprot:9375985-Pyramimonas_sp.AAC.1
MRPHKHGESRRVQVVAAHARDQPAPRTTSVPGKLEPDRLQVGIITFEIRQRLYAVSGIDVAVLTVLEAVRRGAHTRLPDEQVQLQEQLLAQGLPPLVDPFLGIRRGLRRRRGPDGEALRVAHQRLHDGHPPHLNLLRDAIQQIPKTVKWAMAVGLRHLGDKPLLVGAVLGGGVEDDPALAAGSLDHPIQHPFVGVALGASASIGLRNNNVAIR